MFKDSLAIIGGRVLTSPNFVVRLYDLKKNSVADKFEFEGVPLSGFSADRIGDKIYIFGGCFATLSIRECQRKLFVFSKETIQQEISKHVVTATPRRNHGHTVFNDRILLISGGIDSFQRTLWDVQYYDTTKKRWYASQQVKRLPICFHRMQCLPTGYLARFGGFNHRHQYQKLWFSRFQAESDLVFQGWYEPITTGIPAAGRIEHSMHYLNRLKALAIIGGKNEVDYYGIDELCMLDLENLQWLRVNITGSPFSKLYGHTSAYVDSENSIYIVGGQVNSAGTDDCFGTNRIARIKMATADKPGFKESVRMHKESALKRKGLMTSIHTFVHLSLERRLDKIEE